MFEAKHIHSGQYKPYGDSFYVWDIMTDQSEEDTVEWCFRNFYTNRVPPYKEWKSNTSCGGKYRNDLGYYFSGYYTIEKIDGGYRFTKCEPYTD